MASFGHHLLAAFFVARPLGPTWPSHPSGSDTQPTTPLRSCRSCRIGSVPLRMLRRVVVRDVLLRTLENRDVFEKPPWTDSRRVRKRTSRAATPRDVPTPAPGRFNT